MKIEHSRSLAFGTFAAALIAFACVPTVLAEVGYLASPAKLPIVIGGKAVGSTTLAAGTKVEILRQEGGKALVKTAAGEAWLDQGQIVSDPPVSQSAPTATTKAPAPENLPAPPTSNRETPKIQTASAKGDTWRLEKIPFAGVIPERFEQCLAVAEGARAFAFFAKDGLHYAERTKNGWKVESVDLLPEGHSADWPACVVGIRPSGQPEIYYAQVNSQNTESHGALKRATRNNQGWKIQTIKEATHGFTHLRRVGTESAVVFRRTWYLNLLEGFDGETPIVKELPPLFPTSASKRSPGFFPLNAKIAGDKVPVVFFGEQMVEGVLALADYQNGDWSYRIVDSNPSNEDTFSSRSFALDDANRAHILSYRSSTHTIQYVHQDPNDPSKFTTDTYDASLFGIERPEPPQPGKRANFNWFPGELQVGKDGVLRWLYNSRNDGFYAEFTNGHWKITRFPDRKFDCMAMGADGRINLFGRTKQSIDIASWTAAAKTSSAANEAVELRQCSLEPIAPGKIDQEPYKSVDGTETDRATKLAALGDPEKVTLSVTGQDVSFQRWGKGDKAIVFFNHTGPMNESIANEILAYGKLIRSGYSVFVWEYPKAASPFDKIDEVMRFGKKAGPLDFSGVASAVVEQIRTKCGVKDVVLVGNSLGAGIVLWDYVKLAADPGVSFVLISPTELFSPAPATLGPLKNGVMVANEDSDPFVESPEVKKWIAQNKHAQPLQHPLPTEGHLILGDNLSSASASELIGLVPKPTNPK